MRDPAWQGRLLRLGQFLGALAGALGWWLPWALHPSGAAALVLLGLDLGDFLKFTSLYPAIEWHWERQVFYLPPVLAAIAFAPLASEQGCLGRWLLTGLSFFLALVVLPPYIYNTFTPDVLSAYLSAVLFSAEYAFQTWAALVALAFTALTIVGPRLPRPPQALAVGIRVVAGMVGFILPLWAFWWVKPILDGLYGRPVVIGPGLFITSGGFALLALSALVVLARSIRAREASRVSHPAQPASD